MLSTNKTKSYSVGHVEGHWRALFRGVREHREGTTRIIRVRRQVKTLYEHAVFTVLLLFVGRDLTLGAQLPVVGPTDNIFQLISSFF